MSDPILVIETIEIVAFVLIIIGLVLVAISGYLR